MINADKYKKNKFRKLVPSSNSDSSQLQNLTTIEYDKEPLRPQIGISQEIQKNTLKIGIEGLSERYKEKHFTFERRLKTISSLNEKREQDNKNSISPLAKYDEDKKHMEKRRFDSLMSLIQDFKQRTQQVSKTTNVEQLNKIGHRIQIEDEQEIEEKYQGIIQKSKLSSSKLIYIYLQRLLLKMRKDAFFFLVQGKKNIIIEDDEQARYLKSNCRNNLLNISKFFGST